MKVIIHPLLKMTKLQDHYIIIDGDYKGSVYELRNILF